MEIGSHSLAAHRTARSAVMEHAYWLQYISLMLIILCIVVGSFRLEAAATAEAAVSQIAVPGGELSYEDLFTAESSTIAPLKLEAVAQFLLNHDIRAEAVVRPAAGALDTDQSANLAVARSVSLVRALINRGVPADAVRVRAVGSTDGAQVTFSFFREPL